MPRGRSLLWIPALLLVADAATAVDEPTREQRGATASLELDALLGAAPGRGQGPPEMGQGFAQALKPRSFHFPRDHGPHPRFRNEWWYFTGNLRSSEGHRFGYQLVVFRIALTPGAVPRASQWGANQIFMAHFAVTDAAGNRFRSFERFARGAAGLAGARADPFHVWLEDWQVTGNEGDGGWRLRAAANDVEIDLHLRPSKPVVKHGDNGLSRKSAGEGNASHYYSVTRIQTRGTVELADGRYDVRGTSWLDREWSTSALADDQTGWDWFALQLDDGTDVMYYRLRRRDGSVDPHSDGSVVGPGGGVTRLGRRGFRAEVLDRWTSPAGTTYPSRWRVAIDGIDGPLTVVPVRRDQELDVSVRYWEGAVDVLRDGEPVGRGYVELAGYADE